MAITWESMAVAWDKPQHTFLLLWDLDCEFQDLYHIYDQLPTKIARKRASWMRLGAASQDDILRKSLNLGREIQVLMATGKERFGTRFEQGDSTCHTTLAAQLLRLRCEVRGPLSDMAAPAASRSVTYDHLITTTSSIRRACLSALRGQFARLSSPVSSLVLPPPRFSVDYCPLARQLRHDPSNPLVKKLVSKKVRSHHRHDDRELCPLCNVCISVTPHSGLPNYRHILLTSHSAFDAHTPERKATFACNACYKTFDDSYAFLEHVHQKQNGAEASCLRQTSSRSTVHEDFFESDPMVLEQCLRNCVMRELEREGSEDRERRESRVSGVEERERGMEMAVRSLSSADSW